MIEAGSQVEKLIADTMAERGIDRAAAASWLQIHEAARWDTAFAADGLAKIAALQRLRSAH